MLKRIVFHISLFVAGAFFPGVSCVLSCDGFVYGDTLKLGDSGTWKNVSDEQSGQLELEVMELKALIDEGKAAQAKNVYDQLREKYPQLNSEAARAFFKGEFFYARGKLDPAVKAYDKFLRNHPNSMYYYPALERKYLIANAFLNGQKRTVLWVLRLPAWESGVDMMREIADTAGDAPISQRALKTLADSQQDKEKYLDQYETWAEISSRWPTGPVAEEAQFSMAYSLHSAYKGPKYDGASLKGARTYYENIQQRYSAEARQNQVDGKVELLDEQRAYKEYSTGLYYERTESPQAAERYFRFTVENWPETTASRLARQKLDIYEGKAEPEKVEKSLQRKAFDKTEYFLDEWMGKINLRWILKDEE